MTPATSRRLFYWASLREPPYVSQLLDPPPRWRSLVKGMLIDTKQIHNRIKELAKLITLDYQDKNLVILPILKGTIMFVADLVRAIPLPLKLEFVEISSYRNSTQPQTLILTKSIQLDIKNKDVLILDDILDTGQTLQYVRNLINEYKPRSIKICVLLDKTQTRQTDIQADYTGFRIPKMFVVGYGLDYAEQYRNLPFIGVLKEA